MSADRDALDHIRALIEPIIEDSDPRRIATHSTDCHERHVVCLASAIEWLLRGENS